MVRLNLDIVGNRESSRIQSWFTLDIYNVVWIFFGTSLIGTNNIISVNGLFMEAISHHDFFFFPFYDFQGFRNNGKPMFTKMFKIF